jgi:hypothetical protein
MINLENYEQKIYSQNGEDGVTLKLIELLYNNDNNYKFFVEFGVQDGSECNTRILRDKCNWMGLQMDGSNENLSINLRQEFIMKENIIELFNKYNVKKNINLLSVDIDFNDFYCLNEILKHYTCDIIICEYNATHLPNEDKVVLYNKEQMWDYTNYFGCSLLALNNLCKKYNYTLVYCDKKGVNAYFINDKILFENKLEFLNAGDVEKIYKSPKYNTGPNGGHPQDPHNREYVTSVQALR